MIRVGTKVRSLINDPGYGLYINRIGKIESLFGVPGLAHRKPQYAYVRFMGIVGTVLMSAKNLIRHER